MLKLIKEIRKETGAGVVDVKKALEESSGNKEKALDILKKSGLKKADKKANRIAEEGIIVSYIHADGKSGAMLKLLCETDFVAKNSDFNDLASDIAMQIVAMNPMAILPEDVTDKMLTEDIASLKMSGLKGKQLNDKIEEVRKEKALYSQSFVKNPEMTIEELVKSKMVAIGENIKVDKFVKMDI